MSYTTLYERLKFELEYEQTKDSSVKGDDWTEDYQEGYIDGLKRAIEAVEEQNVLDDETTGNDPCEYEVDGADTDGTIWYFCKVHGELAPSDQAPCAGYEETPLWD